MKNKPWTSTLRKFFRITRLFPNPQFRARATMRFDTVIQNGTVVTATDTSLADVGIVGDKISAIGAGLPVENAGRVIDAANHLVIPGGIDVHTHLDMPFGGTTSADVFKAHAQGRKPSRHVLHACEKWRPHRRHRSQTAGGGRARAEVSRAHASHHGRSRSHRPRDCSRGNGRSARLHCSSLLQ